MFCTNCGENVSAVGKFCTQCGATLSASSPVAVKPSASIVAAKPAAGGKRRFSVLPVVGLMVFVAVIGVFFVIRANASLAVSRAAGNFVSEIDERLGTTPLQAIPMLLSSLTDGTVNANFTYVDESWWSSTRVNADVQLVSNARNGASALTGDFEMNGFRYDMSLFLNRDRAAIGSSIVSRDYYGFTFNSFRDDIRPFGRIVGLSNREMDDLSDFVENLGDTLRRGNSVSDELDAYTRALTAMLRDAEQVTNRVDVSVGRETVRARRVAYTLTDSDVFGLLEDWLDILEDDDRIHNIFESDTLPMHRTLINELRSELRRFERDVRGDVTLAFYIGSRNRLVRVDLVGDVRLFGERMRFDVALDLGLSPTDTWSLAADLTANGDSVAFEVVWDARTQGSRYIHTLEATVRERNFTESVSFTSDWNPQNGNFSVTMDERCCCSSRTEELLHGNLRVDGDTFRLRFEQSFFDSWNNRQQEFSINISTETGNAVPDVDFINISDWNQRLLDDMERAFRGMIW